MSRAVDNRDSAEVIRYLEARVEALKRENEQQKLEIIELTRLNVQLQEAIKGLTCLI